MRKILFVFGLIVLFTGLAVGQGAVVERYEGTDLWLVRWNADGDLLGLHSTALVDPLFCESVDSWFVFDEQTVDTPVGPIHDLVKGNLFSWVYAGETVVDDFWADPCAFFAGAVPIAMGISHITHADNDFFQEGPGANAWGNTISGVLYELDGYCASEMVELSHVRKFVWNGKKFLFNWKDNYECVE